MPNVEWSVAHSLVTPGGTIPLNATSGYRYLIQADSYKIVPALRVAEQNISQADGSVINPRWKTGLVATMQLSYTMKPGGEFDSHLNAIDEFACGDDLRTMHQRLTAALDSIREVSTGTQQLQWTTTGAGDRLLDQIVLASWPEPTYDQDGTETLVSFTVESPFPYAVTAASHDTAIGGGVTLITNSGTADYSPTVTVDGPFTTFVLANLMDQDENGNPRKVTYDGSRPGARPLVGGETATIDLFRGTIEIIPLIGPHENLVAGLNPVTTDFWKLLSVSKLGVPNEITLTGDPTTGNVHWANAWC